MKKLFYLLPLIAVLAFGTGDAFAKKKKGGKKGDKKGKATEMTFTGTVSTRKAAAPAEEPAAGKKKKKGKKEYVLTTDDAKEIVLPASIKTKDENGEKKTIKMKDYVDKKVTVTAKATETDGKVEIAKLIKIEEAPAVATE